MPTFLASASSHGRVTLGLNWKIGAAADRVVGLVTNELVILRSSILIR